MLSPRLCGNEIARYLASESAPDQKLSALPAVPPRSLESEAAASGPSCSRATRSSETQLPARVLALNAEMNCAGVVTHLYCARRSR